MVPSARYTPFILRWPVRIVVLCLFIAYLVVSIVGALLALKSATAFS